MHMLRKSSYWLTVTDSAYGPGAGIPEPRAGLLPAQVLGSQSAPQEASTPSESCPLHWEHPASSHQDD